MARSCLAITKKKKGIGSQKTEEEAKAEAKFARNNPGAVSKAALKKEMAAILNKVKEQDSKIEKLEKEASKAKK